MIALAAIREQPVEIFEIKENKKICTVTAGPKTGIHHVKVEILKSAGIPVQLQMLEFAGHKYKDEDLVGIHVFKELAADPTGPLPVLKVTHLTDEEAEAEAGRLKALEKVKHGEKLSHIEERFQADPEIVLLAVETYNPTELQFASDSVRSDRDTMLEALKISSNCCYYVSESLWKDREFVIGAVSTDGMILGFSMVPETWRSDAEIVMYACEQNGYALQLASEELKDNRGVVIAAVNQRGTALMYASEELRSDSSVVLDAVRNNRMAIVHAKGGLREDTEIRAAAGKGPSEVWNDQQRVKQIKAKFHELDGNGDGFLSFDELESLLRRGNPDMADDEIQLLFDEMNTHHDGRVDFHEFCDWVFHETADDEE